MLTPDISPVEVEFIVEVLEEARDEFIHINEFWPEAAVTEHIDRLNEVLEYFGVHNDNEDNAED